ncbi:VWA domain-containing protein [Methanogenium sp. MK-MG]|uniref:VWA domain-containing protein n=1 Tax=Methanogenium sp. MK-MG TaxID=2599926 RepID=UPI0013E9DA2E|nr:VWA domain-containing protein [Methanogenium sp. MK-MG]KAF1077891.1 hypothetical protein MKMG_01187 [Methanogenium sp. MK-MG]
MRNSLRILLVLGVIVGVLPFMVSADPVTDTDVSVDFIIDDGDPADLHDDNGWLVAGSGISSTIRVSYTGDDSPVIHFVKFTSVEKATYGDVTEWPATVMPYETVFSASENTAGDAPIQVQINYTADDIGYDYYRTVYQPIDHNTPMKIRNIAFDSEVTLHETMDVTMTMEDAYGNMVTSLYEGATGGTPEGVTFETTSYAGSGFYDGTGYDAESVRVAVTADGSVVATFRAGTESGPKYLIHIVPDLALNDKWLTITALADGEPYTIAVSVVPNAGDPPYVPADGESRFYLTYNLFDQYGNPSGNQSVHFSDDVIGDEFTRRTNSDGQIMFTFGPFDRMGTYTIHAEAVENVSVAIDQVVRFTNTSPDDMLLTANPQSMPSADVAAGFHADLLAKVTDENGNGVAGEEVSFFLVPPANYSASQTAPPSLAADTALTNLDGVATMQFTPGAFETDSSDPDYNVTASESCTILATWGAVSRMIDLEWKNYPYLRVETEVNPATVEVGDPVDVTIRLIGDGWALYPDPIDVMLSVDRSGSMLKDNPDRMVSLMGALKTFNGEMAENRDAVGITSFGRKGTANIFTYSYDYWAGMDSTSYDDNSYINAHYPGNGKSYSNYATVDLPLSTNRDAVESTIDDLVPMSGTPMRGGLYLAIKEIIENGRDDAVQAVILLSDGDYNYYGDPLARGTGYDYYEKYATSYSTATTSYWRYPDLSEFEQDLSVYAANHNVTIYSIAFGNGLSGNGVTTLRTLAETTGGTYYHAPTGDELVAIYTDIAGDLKTEAGVDTEMDVMFSNLELNNVTQVNDPDDPILEYEYEYGASTLVKSWNVSGSEGSPNIMGPLTLDQTDDWSASQSLSFDSSEIGTIHLGQTWQAVFRLNVLKPGNINIFGEGSAIIFNNGTDSLTLPKTYITAVDNLTATGLNFSGLQVCDLVCVEAENGDVIENELTINWNLNYSGAFTATQYLYYQKEGEGIWITFDEIPVTGPVSELAHTRQLYVADFPPGEYKLRVRAMAEDAPDSVIETPYAIVIGQGGQNFIRLE